MANGKSPPQPHTEMPLEKKAQILDRLIAFKDTSPFILITDSLAQPGLPLVEEFLRKVPPTIHVTHWRKGPLPEIPTDKRSLLVIYDLVAVADIGRVLQSVLSANTCVIGVYHRDLEPDQGYAPKGLALVQYMATTIIHVEPSENTALSIVEHPLLKFTVFGASLLRVQLIHRRRSGNATTGKFIVNTKDHSTSLVTKAQVNEEDPSLLSGLTTFNLNMTEKQRLDKENVELPFIAAQEVGDGGAAGGAIIYQFEKDDDYDEEDPYEDPI